MTSEEKATVTDLKKCNFTEMSEYFKAQSEARKAMTKEQKQVRRCLQAASYNLKPNPSELFC